MKKILTITLVILISQLRAQISYTHIPDSSGVSIIFGKEIINKNKKTFSISINEKYRIKCKDSVKIDFRFIIIDQNPINQKKSVITLIVFGKAQNIIINDATNKFFTKTVAVKQFNKNKTVKVSWVKSNPTTATLYIDSIDVTTK